MIDFTPAERAALKQALLKFKRFWNAGPGTKDEDMRADRLIDSVVELAKEMDK
jgi:hypothetical protein